MSSFLFFFFFFRPFLTFSLSNDLLPSAFISPSALCPRCWMASGVVSAYEQ